jgi:hypothetical protein
LNDLIGIGLTTLKGADTFLVVAPGPFYMKIVRVCFVLFLVLFRGGFSRSVSDPMAV